jgi:hypothetical protein
MIINTIAQKPHTGKAPDTRKRVFFTTGMGTDTRKTVGFTTAIGVDARQMVGSTTDGMGFGGVYLVGTKNACAADLTTF